MEYEQRIRKYRSWYAKLLRFYSKPYYERFSNEMEQTFGDILRERVKEKKELIGHVIWVFIETFIGIIKNNLTTYSMQKNIFKVLLVTVCILLIPLIAMQFTSEVNWTLSDFIIMGALIFGTGLLIDWAVRKAGRYKVITIVGIVLLFLYVWAELAVGVFTNIGS